MSRNGEVIRAFDSLTSNNVYRAFPTDILCPLPARRCRNTIDGQPIYFDDNHLNRQGVALIAPKVASIVEQAVDKIRKMGSNRQAYNAISSPQTHR
ncbi:SGNH hydrolase domain-containing protein [Sphingobium yanoikuyae]|uniref:SGNH hydrolase domain-containing protein n=1 Tax=Sphingobium yanoikuyae TaxID=13690 RepID=UPI0035B47F92